MSHSIAVQGDLLTNLRIHSSQDKTRSHLEWHKIALSSLPILYKKRIKISSKICYLKIGSQKRGALSLVSNDKD